jgi:hypothetical protein
LNDTGQIENLNLCAIVLDLTGNGGEGCEFVGSGFGVLACQSTHEGTFSDRGETDETTVEGQVASCRKVTRYTYTLATPVLATSKPAPAPPPLDVGVSSSLFSFANLAFN